MHGLLGFGSRAGSSRWTWQSSPTASLAPPFFVQFLLYIKPSLFFQHYENYIYLSHSLSLKSQSEIVVVIFNFITI